MAWTPPAAETPWLSCELFVFCLLFEFEAFLLKKPLDLAVLDSWLCCC